MAINILLFCDYWFSSCCNLKRSWSTVISFWTNQTHSSQNLTATI